MSNPEESPFQLALRSESELARTESPFISRLRKALRLDFKRNAEVIEVLTSGRTAEEKSVAVTDLVSARFEEVSSEDVRRETLSLIREFEKLEEQGIREIVVDSQGRAMVPMTENTVYYPTRIDEDGNKSLGFPILHPAISSELTLREVESNEIGRLERLSPVFAFNVKIERTPEPLETRIRQDLEQKGWKIQENEGSLYTEVVGKESKVTLFGRDRNPAFSRIPVWSHAFIRSIPGPPRGIELLAVERCEDDVYRWFEITYRASELR